MACWTRVAVTEFNRDACFFGLALNLDKRFTDIESDNLILAKLAPLCRQHRKKAHIRRWVQVNQPSGMKDYAEVSAPADLSSSLERSLDAELAHFGLERCALHSELECGAHWSADDPIGFTESARDVLPFRLLEGTETVR